MSEADIKARHKQLDLSYKDYLRMQKNLQNYKIDKYYICEQIGEGAFADVYKGVDDQTKKEVAVKIINIRNIQTQKNPRIKRIRKRLVQEQSKIMMKFDNENILKCYECFENRDLKIMIIEYCNQGSLQDKIDSQKKIPQAQAISILKQIINGISQCHQQKIIHRDLKADNILLHNGVCKIADYGFSKMLQIKNQNDVAMGTVLGTMTTMAPEVMNREPYGLKADIWSIGVIFFHMLFGQCPFKSDTSAEMITQIMNSNLATVDEYRGVKPSSKAKKFFRQVLVVNIDKRLGWRQLIDHQLFKNEYSELPQDFHRKIQIKPVDQNLFEMERQFLCDNKTTQSTFSISPEHQSNKQQPLYTQHKQKYQQKQSNRFNQLVEDQNQENLTKLKNDASYHLNKQSKNQIFAKKETQPIKIQQKHQPSSSSPKLQKQKIQINKKEQIKNYTQQEKEPTNKPKNEQSKGKKEQIKPSNNQQPLQKEQQNKVFRKVNAAEVKKAVGQVNKDDEMIFKWAKKIHIECLKTEIIFNNIIKVIETNRLLDISQRNVIQMMYLICTRCLNNMSPINHEYEKHKKNPIIKELQDTVARLYEEVTQKWLHYSGLLTKKQNEKITMVFDFFSKITNKNQRNLRDKFLTGVQSMVQYRAEGAELKKVIQKKEGKIKEDDLLDYDKEEQIQFTYNYIQQSIKNLKYCDAAKQIRNHMSHYKDICRIEFEDMKGRPFKEYLKLLLM